MAFTTDEAFRKYTDAETFSKIIEYESVSEMWEKCIADYADLNAVNFDGKQYTFRQIEDDAASFRDVLEKNGIKKQRLGLLCANSYDFVKAFIAITTSGNSAVILPLHLDETSVFGCSMQIGFKTIIAQDALEEKTSLAKNKGIKIIRTSETSEKKIPLSKDVNGDDECVLMFTGGTTGKSKAAVLNNRAVMQGTKNGCYAYKDVFHQKYILVLPLSHVFGLIRNLMTSLYTGSEIFICKNNKDMFKDIASFKPTILVAVPAIVDMALKLSAQLGKNMFGPCMKYIISGAASVSPYLITECNKIGVTLLAGYGLTESANLVSGNPDNLEAPESVGYFYPNQEYRIENGELWLKGLNMLTRYVGNDLDNENAFEDGWFKTGDLVRIDEKGRLYITGRIKEIIVLPTGENISPAEVEAKFYALSMVQDCQIFEDIDESGNHFLALEVLPRMSELEKISSEDKNDYLLKELEKINASLPSFQRVSKITLRTSDFERTPSMKIKRYKKCN